MAVGDAHVFPGFLTPVLTQISFQSYRLLFSHASERKFASTGYRTHNHQVMNKTRSPLNHSYGTTGQKCRLTEIKNSCRQK